ncbi:FtsK/SpoIIIE domain-containing protein [Streptomyces chumphonensis]|uniref:Cell division protein FtsK n=1 Tax=Streptomyces chumphonensis TaxID=1214925 RepID=A0A927EXS8_9ACTN|nr:FtsK/SpoIIIE domain-containing protein [Streptomyces chumphonensis]MBD3931945.1 cell division protein FtsK [Streptomyces chumphonensis]
MPNPDTLDTTGPGTPSTPLNGVPHPAIRPARVDLDKTPTEPAPTTTPEPADEAVPDGPGTPSTPVPVDDPKLPAPRIFTQKRRPIIPGWLRNRVDFLATLRHNTLNAAYASAYHAVRVPAYTLRLTARAPVGTARCIRGTWHWVADREMAPMCQHAAEKDQVPEYMSLSGKHETRVHRRALIALTAACFGLTTAAALYVLAPGWLYLTASLGVLALGYAGQKRDAPIIGPAVLKTEVPKLTSDVVLRGLAAIGNAKISAAIKAKGEDHGLRFPSPITRDGPGYRADIDLPYGVTPQDVLENRQALASGLRRKVGCVWPSGDPDEHEGRLVLWVGDRPMNEQKRPAWPLLKSGTVDLFQPVPFGNDQRMRDVMVTLMFASVVVGSIPRMGKTFLMRLLLLIAALDPRAELHAYDFKGTGDFGALEPVCHRYRAGEEPEDIEYVLHSLRELKDELRRRAKVIKALPRRRCPESKVTSELANDRKLGLHPIVAAFDECQVPFEDEDHKAEIESICTDLVKRGPALGIVAMFGTQRPDAKSLPKGISDNAVLRFCLKVMGHLANDMVLGQGMNKAGYTGTMFSRSDRGICWMAGEGDDPRIVASAFVDAPMAEAVAKRARQAREEYDNITGHAAGEEPTSTTASFDILGDVLKVVPADEEKVWNERIAARLADLRPDTYEGWEGPQVTAALKPHGVKTGDVWGTTDDGRGTTRRGITRAAIVAAIKARHTA